MNCRGWLSLVVLFGMQAILPATANSAEPARAAAAPAQDKGPKLAIVIGNSNYPSGALANPKNDATAMAASLKKLGFMVELKLDATKADMDAVFKRFSAKAETAGVAALFYAGHGVQVNGSNYLVPIDARPQTERDLKREMVKMDDVIDDMGGAKVKLVFFDACRDNPLSRSFSRGGSRGMAAPVEATGTLISFATKHGNTAADGDGRHSPYTTALLTALESAGGVEIEQMLRKVQQGVRVATNGQQEPWRYGSLDGEFYFQAPAPQADNARLQQEAVDRAVQEAVKRANDQAASDASRRGGEQQGRERDTSSATVELAYWDSIKTSQNPEDFKSYLRRYAKGSFVDLAQNRIAVLEREAKRQGEESRKPAKPAPAFAGNDQTAVELAFWDSIKNSSNVDDLKEYLASYPQGRFAGLARNRLRALGAAPQAAPDTARAVAQAPMQVATIVPDQPAPVTASASTAVSSAFPQAGDSWTYRYVNGWKKSSPNIVMVKVDESAGGRVTDRMSLAGGSGADQRRHDGKLEAAERALGGDVRVVELLPYAQSLLQAGFIPGQEKDLPDLAVGGEILRVKVKFIGQEKLNVPAGSFDASRLEIVGRPAKQQNAQASGHMAVGYVTHTFWFAPEVRRIVKLEHKTANVSDRPLDNDSLELLSFSLR